MKLLHQTIMKILKACRYKTSWQLEKEAVKRESFLKTFRLQVYTSRLEAKQKKRAVTQTISLWFPDSLVNMYHFTFCCKQKPFRMSRATAQILRPSGTQCSTVHHLRPNATSGLMETCCYLSFSLTVICWHQEMEVLEDVIYVTKTNATFLAAAFCLVSSW